MHKKAWNRHRIIVHAQALDCTHLQSTYGISLPPWPLSLERCINVITLEDFIST